MISPYRPIPIPNAALELEVQAFMTACTFFPGTTIKEYNKGKGKAPRETLNLTDTEAKLILTECKLRYHQSSN